MSPLEIIHAHPMYINIAVHYVRPKQITYVRDALQAVICEVVSSDDLDLEADPSLVITETKIATGFMLTVFLEDSSNPDKYRGNEVWHG
jgi:hypothetical protein